MVTTMLLVGFALAGAKPAEKRITLSVKDAEIHNVLRLVADAARLNIVIADSVSGKVTIKLRDVPVYRALDAILATKGLGYLRSGNVVEVDTLERLTRRAEVEAERQVQREALAPLVTVVIPLSYANAAELAPIVKAMLSPRGTVVVAPGTNALIVTDVRARSWRSGASRREGSSKRSERSDGQGSVSQLQKRVSKRR